MGAHPRYDARFYALGPARTVAEIAAATGARLVQPHLAARRIVGVAPIDDAGGDELSFADGRKAAERALKTRAGACLADAAPRDCAEDGAAWLLAADPKAAFIDAVRLFVKDIEAEPSVHPRATIAPGASLGVGVAIGAGAVVEEAVVIGAGSRIGPGAVIKRGVVLGEACVVEANAVLSHAVLGDRVRVGSNAVIGGAGFGFASGRRGHRRLPQIGRVIVGDDVEIGSCTTVDRGALDDTVIEEGVKIDNLVQVAHNCHIGAHAILVGQVGLSGSCEVGAFALLGGQAGVADHVKIGAGARVGARAGVMRAVEPGAKVLGAPAKPAYAFFREIAALQRLAKADKAKDRKA